MTATATPFDPRKCECTINCARPECQPNRVARTAGAPTFSTFPNAEGVDVDPRTQAALDQLSAVEDELDAAICWADKPDGDNVPHLMGRNVRVCAELVKAAIANLHPAPGKPTVKAIVGQHRALVNEERRTMAADQLALSIPKQSAPAFANKAGAR